MHCIKGKDMMLSVGVMELRKLTNIGLRIVDLQ